ncbi:hypothetical protein M8997_000450 [Phyllobacterium sp. 21LDTY02-6]|uniref:hypothetical protein n=1 Tax=unclassified Phyllobacterium TaxID=2638441 RepID=UPI0020211832|nr:MULTISPECIES: hypothetical protein [unclassified Phyllobacterium]MCO4315637.1 hypothetical protein [Phyllobacterium sp. 21LDTY02-6]MCX8280951.1 hypothetical protein [Phyllobacterium sp. 0TCS1.6C]MCX8295817.1 hypothetical protein [Phyllobacterium sp. 0TCS1.6A]
MKRTQFSTQRVDLITSHLTEVVRDLRLVDAADYIAFIRCELFGNIADIVNSATELHFHPGTLTFGLGGDYILDWASSPVVTLDLEFCNLGVSAYFRLILSAEESKIDLHHLRFAETGRSPAENTELLDAAFQDARLPQLAAPERME